MSGPAMEAEALNCKPGPIELMPDPPHDIKFAIQSMKEGKLVKRANWNGKELRVGLQIRDNGSKNTEPYVYMLMPGADGESYRVPWTCSQTDLLAHDWEIVE